MILKEKLQKYWPYHQVKVINTNYNIYIYIYIYIYHLRKGNILLMSFDQYNI